MSLHASPNAKPVKPKLANNGIMSTPITENIFNDATAQIVSLIACFNKVDILLSTNLSLDLSITLCMAFII